nr:hypothetical protein [Tanacetum cinerariifolium]
MALRVDSRQDYWWLRAIRTKVWWINVIPEMCVLKWRVIKKKDFEEVKKQDCPYSIIGSSDHSKGRCGLASTHYDVSLE